MKSNAVKWFIKDAKMHGFKCAIVILRARKYNDYFKKELKEAERIDREMREEFEMKLEEGTLTELTTSKEKKEQLSSEDISMMNNLRNDEFVATVLEEAHASGDGQLQKIVDRLNYLEKHKLIDSLEAAEAAKRLGYVLTNMGAMPEEDYLDIVAYQHGYDSYDEMRKGIAEELKEGII